MVGDAAEACGHARGVVVADGWCYNENVNERDICRTSVGDAEATETDGVKAVEEREIQGVRRGRPRSTPPVLRANVALV